MLFDVSISAPVVPGPPRDTAHTLPDETLTQASEISYAKSPYAGWVVGAAGAGTIPAAIWVWASSLAGRQHNLLAAS
jgi:hypothetical protein